MNGFVYIFIPSDGMLEFISFSKGSQIDHSL